MSDIFRDTWVRYIGYANEVGESFRPLVPVQWVRYSYGIAFGYVLADTADKSIKMLRKDGRPTKVLAATGDALIWQTLASVVIPGIVINRIVCFSQYQLGRHAKRIPLKTRCWMAVGAGLVSIPIIVRPIDAGVTMLMNLTYRKIFGI